MKRSIGDIEVRALYDACVLAEKRISVVLDVTSEDATLLNLRFPLTVLRTALEMYGKGDQNGKEKSEKESF